MASGRGGSGGQGKGGGSGAGRRSPIRCGAAAEPAGHAAGREPVERPTDSTGLNQRGAVTAEVAVVLPALVVLLALVLGTAHFGTAQLRIEEAARAGAREAMRGESAASVRGTAQRLAGSDASVEIAAGAGWTTVKVSVEVEGPMVGLFGIELDASASGKKESGG
ncbi:hypothetical protein E8P82_00365 [Arthrobacter echini]|uniref:TadE-like domain-containing protein n=1 Tax=Arthrobacter echini TaxID=1529066 RepID=A0A4S5E9Z0_9MICC|nr:TadE family type IV pilus minor pilin [Arthrobacter echini]THJ68410.1 hypothetical protein E8P82_00365 [Arthrobacter echini]